MENLNIQTSPFQLKFQRIKKIDFNLNESLEADKALDIQANINIKKNEEKLIAVVELIFFINKDNNSAKINATIINEGIFEWDKNLDNLETYLKVNAPAVLFSQIRTLFSTLTLAAGIPNMNIPLINFDNTDNSK